MTERTLCETRSLKINCKAVLLGGVCVGKSSLALRIGTGRENVSPSSTIGAAFCEKTVFLDGVDICFELWDTAGQERYDSLTKLYYRKAHAAIVVYDITDKDSYVRAKAWVRELQESTDPCPNIVIAFVGNKLDLAHQRIVEQSEAQSYADENDLLYMETSAKTAVNVEELLKTIATEVHRNHRTEGTQQTDSDAEGTQPLNNGVVELRQTAGTDTASGCCR